MTTLETVVDDDDLGCIDLCANCGGQTFGLHRYNDLGNFSNWFWREGCTDCYWPTGVDAPLPDGVGLLFGS